MDMDNEQTSPSNLVKWPFFASAVFILGFVLYFALNRPPDEPLDQWQLATCVLSSALACILIFLPYLLEKFLELALNPSADREEQLIQKIYFELKELRDDLGKLGVKVEKVPALVDKIVTESSGNDDAAFSEAVKLGGELEALRKEIGERFDGLRKPLEDAAAPQPDVALSTIPDAIDDIRERIEETLTAVQAIKPAKRKASRKKEPEPEPEPTPIAQSEPESESESEPDPLVEEQPESNKEPEPETPEEEPSSAEGQEIPQEPEEEAVNEEPEPESEPSEEEEPEPDTPESQEEPETEIEEPAPEEEPETEELSEDDAEDTEEEPEQAELDLPDPAETLRKVDAILEETNPDRPKKPKKDEPEESVAETSDNGGATAVVAKVKIGIGNKPFLRGEGPGLSWEEGVPMNFVEIGKWAWSPSDKDTPLVVQVYRNDEDPDPTGKHEVEPGQKLELSPDFPEQG